MQPLLLPTKVHQLGVALLLLFAALSSAAQPSPLAHDLGSRAQHFLRSSYFLQAAGSGECRPYVSRAHDAGADLQNIVANVPGEVKLLLSPSGEMVRTTKNQAYEEVELMRRKAQESNGTLEFRCGVLLGIASAVYYQSLSRWTEITSQPTPAWRLP